jgi:hypothetical protein
MHRLYSIGQPPPQPTFERAVAHRNFVLRAATPWLEVREESGRVRVRTPHGDERFDFIFAATGVAVDLAMRPEFAHVAPQAAFWRDRFTPPAGREDARLAGFPYLGRYCDFTERAPGCAPWLSRVFTITRGATLSMGPSAASNSNVKYTAPRIIAGVTRALFLDGADAFLDKFNEGGHHEIAADQAQALTARAAAAA